VPQIRTGIIVLNWNGLQDTKECLVSLFELHAPSIRFYVVDNGSTDSSAAALETEFGESIMLIRNERNLLYAAGNNVALVRALKDGCTHILLLNNDTTVDPEMMKELLQVSANYGDAVLCPKIYYANEPNKIWYAGGRFSLKRARSAHRGIREFDRGQYNQIEETDWATGCALFASRRVFEVVGLLDESFELYSEDLDFCLRAKEAGFKIVFVPTAKVWHKVSASVGGNLSSEKLIRKWRSLRRLVKKHIPNPIMRVIALADFLITEPPRVLIAALRGKLS
jgi:GT2 family glycosyltransferase